jgi:penicillin amidase
VRTTRSRTSSAINLLAAIAVLGGLLFGGIKGAGPLPPLGPLLNPGTGVWTSAADAHLPTTQTLHLDGWQQPARVTFETNGTAHIVAASDHDLFMTVGYLHATFRLTQMDLERRQGEGLLSQVVGKAALDSDEFELQLGLERTAQAEWAQHASDPDTRTVLDAYSAGVNTAISQQEQSGHLPMMFKLLGYQPSPWTPIDTLVVKGIMTQTLDFTDGPLQFALLAKALGEQRAEQWFPILPANGQHPYDLGPYHAGGVTAIAAPVNADALPASASTGASPGGATTSAPLGMTGGESQSVTAAEAIAASSLLARFAALPPTALHADSNSNNWAVDGTKTASGKPMLAGDPHLGQTLPAIWYQLDAESPTYQASGVSIPGTPVVLIGHNQHISWSLTNTQNSATLYYAEQTDRAHANQYFWRGSWRRMRTFQYSIPVKGSAPERFAVQETVHGPVLTLDGQTTSVWWAGSVPSQDLRVVLNIGRAGDFTAFRDALRQWYAPTQNFVYADDQGNVGLVSAGYYPQVPAGAKPWLPLPGDGSADVQGTIPFDDIPQVYDPPTHFVFSANQREVGPSYPYYIGTALDFFDVGYRADEIQQTLSTGQNLTVADMERLQNDTRDYLAGEIVPELLAALQGQALSPQQQQASALLQSWDDDMGVNSAAASIWWRFWTQYAYDTFNPWWQADRVPIAKDSAIALHPDMLSSASRVLGEDLEAWTLHEPTNPGLALPDGTARTAPQLMRQAFTDAVDALAKQLGPDPSQWTWGKIHFRQFRSLLQIPALGYGPRGSSGDTWTVDAASGGSLTSTAGPSWRFIMDWGADQGYGVYPGGQSENPLSPWYENEIAAWWDGSYYPMRDVTQLAGLDGAQTWTIQP